MVSGHDHALRIAQSIELEAVEQDAPSLLRRGFAEGDLS